MLVLGWYALAPAHHAGAQTIFLRDGMSVPTQGLRRDGATVLARIQTAAGTSGEAGYPVDNIARIEFPEPPQLKTAPDLMKAGKASEAVNQLEPAATYYAAFRDLPGNWWAPLALLEVDALARLGRERELDTLLAELTRVEATNPDMLRAVKIQEGAALERRGQHQAALAALEPLVKDTTVPPSVLVEAWLAIGKARLAVRDFQPALLAFLHVPVYAPDRVLLMPSALLGSASAYTQLNDKPRAQEALATLVAEYPNSTEAGEAKERLQKLKSPPAKPAGS
jgi:tetratricopeptide (TPR) repeat protein